MVASPNLELARSRQWFDLELQTLRKQVVRVAGGAQVVTWVSDGTPVVAARIGPVSAVDQERLEASRPIQRATYVLVLPWNVDLPDDAHATVTHPTEGWTLHLSIIGRHSPRSNQVVTKLFAEVSKEEVTVAP